MGLTALSTALNPGRNWESSRHAADICDSVLREIDIMHDVDLPVCI